jgi:hypothetical protein
MRAEQTLYAALTADAGIQALIGEKIFPDVRPAETGKVPCIVYTRTDTEIVRGINGAVLVKRALLQVACLATLRLAAEELADLVATLIVASNFEYLNRSAAYEPESEIYVAALDVQIVE